MYMAFAIDFSRGFWNGTLPCPIMIKGAKLLAASTSAVESLLKMLCVTCTEQEATFMYVNMSLFETCYSRRMSRTCFM